MSLRAWGTAELPHFDSERQRGLEDFWHAYEANSEELTRQLIPVVAELPQLSMVLKQITPAQMEEQNQLSLQLMKQALLEGHWEPLMANNRMQGATYAAMGIRFREWFELVSAFQRMLVPELVKRYGDDARRLANVIGAMNDYVDIAMSVIGDEYLKTKEKLISSQQDAIRELSTPVLQLEARLLLLPIVGVLDTQRARTLTDHLLAEIRQERARAVVIDITGVPAVDSSVANHLLQTISAARLMGAAVFVTGLSAHVAQALVTLGVGLTGIETCGNLQDGIEAARALISDGK